MWKIIYVLAVLIPIPLLILAIFKMPSWYYLVMTTYISTVSIFYFFEVGLPEMTTDKRHLKQTELDEITDCLYAIPFISCIYLNPFVLVFAPETKDYMIVVDIIFLILYVGLAIKIYKDK